MKTASAKGGINGQVRVNNILIFLGLFIVTILTRFPFLSTTSAGIDPDAWRIALAARHLATTGEYVASRFPSYPVHEIGSAIGWFGGIGGMNLLTVLLSGVAAGFFGLILKRLKVRAYLLGAIALAFTPVVFINSFVTMDYVWSLAFILGGLYFSLYIRPIWAGVFLGLAIGTRLTAGAMLLPLAWLFLTQNLNDLSKGAGPNKRRLHLKSTLIFAAATFSVALICYLPPLLIYGFGVFSFYDGMLPLRIALHHATLDVWGEVGFFAIVAAMLWVTVRQPKVPVSLHRVNQALMIAILLYLLAYVRLPLEAGYLIPLVPFLLAWLAIRLPHRGFTMVCLALLISPFLLDLEAESSIPAEAKHPSLLLEVGSSKMRLLVLGPIFTEQARQKAYAAQVDTLVSRIRELPRPAIVLAGGQSARLDVTLGEAGKGLVIVPSLDRLWEERDIDPLSLLWPPTDAMRDWPIYVLPEVDFPERKDPRLGGRVPVAVPDIH